MKKIAFGVGILASFVACVGIANALQSFDDAIFVPSLHVGSQGEGGVTFFNGTIINNTTDSEGEGLPVTFGDDVRIDGGLQRGNNSDTDVWPVKINDDLMVYGDIDLTGTLNSEDVSYDGSSSGLEATTMQEAIDAVGTTLQQLIYDNSGHSWTSVRQTVDCSQSVDCTFDPTFGDIVFTATSTTEGTFTSSYDVLLKAGNYCGFADEQDTFVGDYKVVGNFIIIKNYWADGYPFPNGDLYKRKGDAAFFVEVVNDNQMNLINENEELVHIAL